MIKNLQEMRSIQIRALINWIRSAWFDSNRPDANLKRCVLNWRWKIVQFDRHRCNHFPYKKKKKKTICVDAIRNYAGASAIIYWHANHDPLYFFLSPARRTNGLEILAKCREVSGCAFHRSCSTIIRWIVAIHAPFPAPCNNFSPIYNCSSSDRRNK